MEKGEIKKGEKTVVVLRYLGPKGGPGESVSRDLLCLRRSLGDGFGNFGVRDTNVSLRSIYPSMAPLIVCPFYDDPFVLPVPPAGEHVHISAEPFSSFFPLVDGDECGIASVDGVLLGNTVVNSDKTQSDASVRIPRRHRTPLPHCRDLGSCGGGADRGTTPSNLCSTGCIGSLLTCSTTGVAMGE